MTAIPGVIVSDVKRLPDARGSFAEIARESAYPETFVQLNHSHSRGRVLRGLHFHREQADLWYVVRGRAQVALVDLRDGGRHRVETLVLDGSQPQTLYIPPGVAHGYLALTDVDLFYLVTREYDETDEFGVAWDDPGLAIPWELSDPVLSERDRSNPPATGG
ncbi:MAG TPA: dTDP-4-dehydrorhamnose 3,5-epimerase family protein [Actinomycetota bacterium]|nr:dTDP-4-dehydrorhamnose 3,5-epimerase family protein [Actinomycetota bacterium]